LIAPRRGPKISPQSGHALALLDDAGTEALLIANAATIEVTVDLVRVGLATATPQRVKAGRERMEVTTLRITEAGRKALATK
jgi:hypothetical protein